MCPFSFFVASQVPTDTVERPVVATRMGESNPMWKGDGDEEESRTGGTVNPMLGCYGTKSRMGEQSISEFEQSARMYRSRMGESSVDLSDTCSIATSSVNCAGLA